MADTNTDATALQQHFAQQRQIQASIAQLFAPEDAGLQAALTNAKEAGLPEIQISPIQGKLLQLLGTLCHAHKILEIGSLAGYSGIWLARSLPADGRFITLEIDPKHAEVVRNSYAKAGVADRAEVRVGKALDTLPTLEAEAPFDVVFIDADKPTYPQYLEWALRLTRPGSLIIADNTVRGGEALRDPAQMSDAYFIGAAEYNKRVLNNPRLLSLALAIDDDYTDGFTISVVLP
jgi:caffeoyl-CoA O-methyltransferase